MTVVECTSRRVNRLGVTAGLMNGKEAGMRDRTDSHGHENLERWLVTPLSSWGCLCHRKPAETAMVHHETPSEIRGEDFGSYDLMRSRRAAPLQRPAKMTRELSELEMRKHLGGR